MKWLLVVLCCCRGSEPPAPPPAPPVARDAAPSMVPQLPASPDGRQEIAALDERIRIHAGDADPELEIVLLLERAAIRGRVEDYTDALARSQAWVTREPRARRAWQNRVTVLARVHKFADARAALAKLRPLAKADVAGLEAMLDEAIGKGAEAYRAAMARDYPDPATLTQWAASLAVAGRHADALAAMQRVPGALHDNSPELVAWILFQWGRIYEQQGELATARDFYAAAYARLPTVEAAVHLAQATLATGGDPHAVVAEGLAADRHPDLLALAGMVTEARTEWERYLTALPEAFADHAARFFLGPGHDARRAKELALANFANRETLEARALVVEAELAAGDPQAACAMAEPLRDAPRPQAFLAWRALAACGRSGDADAIARRLGIAPPPSE